MRPFLLLLLSLSVSPAAEQARWWRGNTHTHTELCGHADSSPAAVAQWYLDNGYHFLCLSEHDQLIDPAGVELPADRRPDFILIPGEELTVRGNVHMTALNIPALIRSGGDRKGGVVQAGTDSIRAGGGVPILNHPNWNRAVKAAELKPTRRLHLFELYNGHPKAYNFGEEGRSPSLEAVWNELLDAGMIIYAVSADDAHNFKKRSPQLTNPGRGWIMVRAAELNPATICAAIERGDFYASSGVMLAELRADAKGYHVSVDQALSTAAIGQETLIPHRPGDDAQAGCRIDFIGPGGQLVHSAEGVQASCPRDRTLPWLRAKVTLTWRDKTGMAQAFAWTQPVFHDGRLKQAEIPAVQQDWAD